MIATKICRVPASAASNLELPFAQVTRDVLDDDDGVVDQQPERDDESGNGNLVERVAA